MNHSRKNLHVDIFTLTKMHFILENKTPGHKNSHPAQ